MSPNIQYVLNLFYWTFYKQQIFPEVIQFLSEEKESDLKKARLTNDVRYQEFNEVTLD